MSSGFSGGGADFYGTGGIGGRSMTMNSAQAQYRSQLAGILVDPSSQILHRRPDLIGKRSLADFQTNQQLQQQQQQQGLGLFLRSVKPRTYQQHTSPISPLSPVDFSANISPDVSSVSSSLAFSGRYGYGLPLLQQPRPHPTSLGNGNGNGHCNNNPCLPGGSYPSLVHNRVVGQQQSEPEYEKKMRNRLQELEKQLLDDNDEDDGHENDAASVITTTEWTETIQSLISPSPTSSSSSCSSSLPSSSPKQSLAEAAVAISEGKADVAVEILTRLTHHVAKPRGNSEQRLTAYMASALRSRLNPTENPPPVAELYSKEHVACTQMLYKVSPCFKLGFLAANLAIIEATSSDQKLHVVDFDIGHGDQYVNLVHALSARGKPTVVKITAVGDCSKGGEERLRVVGDGLRKEAKRVGVCLKFNVVTQRICDLSRDSLGCEPDEALAVNFAYRLYRMPDESVTTENPRDELLRRVKSLGPRVVTLVEQEMNANTAPFVARVGEVCAYYGALFDSLDSPVSRDNPERVRVEECLGRKAGNSVACEGRDRVERCEVFGKWRARMGMAGFEPRPLSQNVADSLRVKLNSGVTVKEETGGICFGWMGRTLTVASAWR